MHDRRAGACLGPGRRCLRCRDGAAARAWVRQDGHAFDAASVSDADLEPLRGRLDTARLIGIGEATHGTHQDQAFKAALIESLVRAGSIDVVVLECNRAAAVGFGRYSRDGVGDPVALVQSPGFFHGFVGWNLDAATFQTDPAHDRTNPPDLGFDLMVWFRTMGPARSWPEAASGR